MKLTLLFRSLLVCGAIASASSAHALSITAFGSANAAPLASSLGLSGITLVPGSVTYAGASGSTLATTQVGTFSGFSLSGPQGTRVLNNGVVLATGDLAFSTSANVSNNYATSLASEASNTKLSALAGGALTRDASSLSFQFTAQTGVNAVSISFVFATEEYPTQTVTDIFGFFIDGVNYAKFPDGALVQNQAGSSNFTQGWNIEHNGISQVLTAVGLLDSTKTLHTFEFGIADTDDTIYDSAVFISDFGAGTTGSTTGGVGTVIVPTTPPPTGTVPVPGSMLLLGVGALGLIARRKTIA
jgi:PEP-CTERM motif